MASCFLCNQKFCFLEKEIENSKTALNISNEYPLASQKVGYEISKEVDINKNKIGSTIKKIQFFHNEYQTDYFPWIKKECFSILKNETKHKLIVLRIINSYNNNEDKPTILYSHENLVDLGSIYSFMIDLSTQFKCDVISYDYTGFGRSDGFCSEKNIYSDIEEVANFVTDFLKIRHQNIILLGNTIGCNATVHIATDEKFTYEFKNMILVSPNISSLKILANNIKKNINPMSQVFIQLTDKNNEGETSNKTEIHNLNYFKQAQFNVPIFIITSKEDESLTYLNCLDFVKKYKIQDSWFPTNVNFTNLLTNCRKKFIEKSKDFLKRVMLYNNNDSLYANALNDDKSQLQSMDANKLIMKFIRNNNRQENNFTKENEIQNNRLKNYYEKITLLEMEEVKHELKKLNLKSNELNESVKKSKNEFLRNIDFESGNKILLTNMISSEDFGKTLEAEAYYLFGERSSYINNYSLRDAKELESRFNRIDDTRGMN